jgi:hypothetical protein
MGTYSKYILCDRYPASLLVSRSDLQKIHVTWSLSTVVMSPRTQKTELPLLLRDLATDCLPRICLRGNLFNNTLPNNGCTCSNIKTTDTWNRLNNFITFWKRNSFSYIDSLKYYSVYSYCYVTATRWADIPRPFLGSGSVNTFPFLGSRFLTIP